MQAVWYERNGPAREVLNFGDMPDPEPGAGEVQVHVHASGVNPSDWKTRSGSRPMVAPRVIPHSDGAGVIDRVGPNVDPARIGERVWLWNAQWKRAFGTAATHIALPSSQAVRLPDGIPFEAGACLGIPALTAHRAVTADGSPEGQIVLVAGGAGGNAALLPKIVAQGGLCVAYGSNTPQAAFEFGPMILSGAAVRFFIVYELSAAARQRGVSDLTRWMAEGRLRHAIGATLPLVRTVEAHELVEGGKVIGNVIVRP